MTINALVRYAHPEPGEETLTFVVVELRGDCVLLRSCDFADARVTPTEVVLLTDIIEVTGEK